MLDELVWVTPFLGYKRQVVNTMDEAAKYISNMDEKNAHIKSVISVV